ncbi:MAG: PKD domain-containing protein [Candidatus Cloacimonetes bacterium]|nr:PKD domain-containing protein [Candidatus Cloacimonadota bacterium]
MMKIRIVFFLFMMMFVLVNAVVVTVDSGVGILDSVDPVVTISYPAGGEEFLTEDSVNIEFCIIEDYFNDNLAEPVLLEFYYDDEHNADEDVSLAAEPDSNYEYNWQVPQIVSNDVFSRVTAIDYFGNTGSGVSGNFQVREFAADFSADTLTGIEPLEVQFTDLSGGNPVGWEWDFDNDGEIDSYAQNPVWIYYEPGIYSVCLTITDSVGRATSTELKEDFITVFGNQEISLNAGWNLISINMELVDNSIDAIFSEQIANDNLIQVKDTKLTDVPLITQYFNTLDNFSNGYGYWVRLQSSDTVQISGTYLDPDSTVIPLNAGWNLISFIPESNMNVEIAFAELVDLDYLIMVKSITESYDPNLDPGFNTLSTLVPGMAYWVRVSNDIDFFYPASGSRNGQSVIRQTTNRDNEIFEPVIYTNSTTLFGEVTIDNIQAESGDIVAAFVEGECRGCQEVVIHDSIAYVSLLINGEMPESVSFAVYDASADEIINVEYSTMTYPGDIIGYPPDLMPIDAYSVTLGSQEISLNAGWNLFSVNLALENSNLEEVFADQISEGELVQVKDTKLTEVPDIPDYFNTLEAMEQGIGYWVDVEEDCSVTLEGVTLDPANTLIAINEGWNLIAYTPQTEMDVEDAFAALIDLDYLMKVKSITQSFDPDLNPMFNTLETLEPGMAYWVRVTNDIDFYYPDSGSRCNRPVIRQSIIRDNDIFEPVIYTNTTTLFGEVTIDDFPAEESDIVAAFVNGECRGCQEVIIHDGTAYVSLLINGEVSENVSFAVYDASADMTYDIEYITQSNPGGFLGYPPELVILSAMSSLTADFTADPTSGLAPLTVEFLDISYGNPISWAWDFENDGEIDSNTQNPVWEYDELGVYSVSLTVADDSGRETSTELKVDYITVVEELPEFPRPWNVAYYANSTVAYCEVTIDDEPAASGDEVGAFVNDQCRGIGQVAMNGSQAVSTFGIQGETIEIVNFAVYDVSRDMVCSVSYTTQSHPGHDIGYPPNLLPIAATSYLNPALIADFTADITSGPAPLTVEFSDISYGNPVSWAWDFENDGEIDSYEQNPVWEYDEPGVYSVSITVADDAGRETSTELKEDYISIFESGEDIVAYFPLDGNAADESGNNHHGTNHGATATEDRFFNSTGAMHFNGEDQYITTDLILQYGINESFTWSTWIRSEEVFNIYGNSIILGYEDSDDGEVTMCVFNSEHINYANKIAATSRCDGYFSHGGQHIAYSNYQIAGDNNWHHIVWIRDRNNMQYKFYLDGVLEMTIEDNTNNFINGSSRPLGIGCQSHNYGWDKYFHGSIDDIQIFNRALSNLEVQELYTNWMPDFSADPVSGIAPLSVEFTDLSTLQDSIISWEWDFENDGVIDSYQQNPVWVYENPGIYSVSLTVELSNGLNASTKIKEDYIMVMEDQEINLDAGWNLFSINMELEDNSIEGIFSEQIAADNLIQVKDTKLTDVPLLSQYFNTLDNFSNGYGYWVKVGSSDTVQISGTYLDPASTVIHLNAGWNLISFIPESNMNVEIAFAELVDLDYLIRVTSITESYDPSLGSGFNTLSTLVPGMAYWVRVTTDVDFYYPASGGRNGRSVIRQSTTRDNNIFEPVIYRNTTTLFGEVSIDGVPAEESDIVAAYINGECRGYQEVVISEGTAYVSLLINGESQESVSFAVYDASADITYDIEYITQSNPGGFLGYPPELVILSAMSSLTADFTADPTSGLTPLTVDFSDISSGNPISWAWDFENDGEIDSNAQNPTWVYDESGVYSVSLTVADDSRREASTELKVDYIIVGEELLTFPRPWNVVYYTNSTIAYCEVTIDGDPAADDDEVGAFVDGECRAVGYVNNNGGVPYALYLNIQGEYIETVHFAVYDVSEDMVCRVSFTTQSNPGGDIGYPPNLLPIAASSYSYPGIIADFAADITSGPAPLTVEFSDISYGNLISWAWDFENDGEIDSYEQNPAWVYDEPGVYNVSLTISDSTRNSSTEIKEDFITVFSNQETYLDAGWNLFSINMELEDNSIEAIFSEQIADDNLIQVKDTKLTDVPLIPQYFNTLDNFSNGYGYWVKVGNSDTVEICGTYLDPATTVIPFNAGWNLVAFIPESNMNVETAFAELVDLNCLIKVKSITQSYDPNLDPGFNTLQTLVPGMAYWVEVTNDIDFYYPASGSRSNRSVIRQSTTRDNDIFDPVIYTNSTTLFGEVTIDGFPAEESDIVAAFVNGECRGYQEVVINDGAAYASLLINGEAAEEISFAVYDASADITYDIEYTTLSDPGDILGYPPDLIQFAAASGLEIHYFPRPWNVTYYANATVAFSLVTIDGEPAANDDEVGAFVDEQCRSVGQIMMSGSQAICTMNIQGEVIETLNFAVYDVSEDMVCIVSFTTQSNPGGDIGYPPNLLPIAASSYVNPALIADFTADITTGPAPLTVEFSDISSGNPISWAWDFDNDGEIDSYEQEPVWSYDEPGVYSVSLTVSDSTRLISTELKDDYISVLEYYNFPRPWDTVCYTNTTYAYCDVTIDGEMADEGDEVGAFVGEECRGVGSVVYTGSQTISSINIQGDEAETVNFAVYDVSRDLVCTVTYETYTNPGNDIGYPPNLLPIDAISGTGIDLDIDLNTGWNLVSLNVHLENSEIESVFADLMSNGLVKVKDTKSVEDPSLSPTFNTLTHLTDGCGYWIKMANSANLNIYGSYLNPETIGISLKAGWNLIACITQGSMNVEVAFEDLINNGNLIKVKNITTSFDPLLGQGFNTLTTVHPGEAYWVRVNNDTEFYYPSPAGRSNRSVIRETNTRDDEVFEPVIYTNSTVMYGEVTVNGEPAEAGDIVAAFVDGECRGSQEVVLDQELAYVSMLINGDTTETVTFSVYDASSDMIYEAGFTTNSSPGTDIGYPPNLCPIDVYAPLLSDLFAEPDSGMAPLTVEFSAVVNPNVVSWAWDFEHDGVIDSYESNPQWIYYQPGVYCVSLTVTDEQSNAETLIKEDFVTVTQNINTPIIELPDSLFFNEDETLDEDFSQYLYDPNGDSLSLTVTDNVEINVSIVDTEVHFSALDNWFGNETLIFTVHDNSNRLSASDTVTVHVNPVNDAPEIDLPETLYLDGCGQLEINLENYAWDVDNENLAYSVVTGDTLIANVSGSIVNICAEPSWLGSETVLFYVDDQFERLTACDTVLVVKDVSPYPVLEDVYDVPDDQGGWVMAEFTRSGLDTDSLITRPNEQYLVEYLVDGDWIAAGSTIAYGAETYQVLVHTLQDSMPGDSNIYEFRVIAGMDEGNFVSNIMIGYSLDNICPQVPTELLFDAGYIVWNEPVDEDFAYFCVFLDGELLEYITEPVLNIIGESGDYQISAVDCHANESELSPAISGGYPYGDVNHNIEVEAIDASLVLQYFCLLITDWENWQITVADVDGNGCVEAYDAALILMFTVDMIDEFPVETISRQNPEDK